MDYVKTILSALGAIFLSLLLPTIAVVVNGIRQHEATGFGLAPRGFLERISTPAFWILAVLFFALFFMTSRLGNKSLRVALFWIPATVVVTLGIASSALFAYFFLRFRTH